MVSGFIYWLKVLDFSSKTGVTVLLIIFIILQSCFCYRVEGNGFLVFIEI